MRINRNIGQFQPEARRARGTTTPPRTDDGASVVSINKNARAQGASIKGEMAARLDAVRHQLANGTYEVDFDRLAENIISQELGSDPSRGEE